MADKKDADFLPLVEEFVQVDKREVIRDRARVHIITREHEELIRQDLLREDVEVTRVPLERDIDALPEVRQEGDVTIVPVVEEVLVVETRLVLKEEIHIRRIRSVEPTETTVTLRKQEAVVERLAPDDSPDP
jgi:stress response protein YsnF